MIYDGVYKMDEEEGEDELQVKHRDGRGIYKILS
jgi:hypothetical protein